VRQIRDNAGAVGFDDSSMRESSAISARRGDSELPSSGTFLASSVSRGALAGFNRSFCALLGLKEAPAYSALVRTLRESGVDVLEFDPSLADWSESLRPQIVDVAVLHAGRMNLNCAALAHDPDFGFPELVLAVDHGSTAQRLALLSRGYRHIIDVDRLSTWLPDQLTSLCTLAMARRIVLEACSKEAPPSDLTLRTVATSRMNLHAAETNFRETFLRALLTEHGSRRGAAEAAGVPYRSFCEMLRKLSI